MDQILADNIKRYRKVRGFTQPRLADLAKISFRSVQDIEYKKSWPSIDTIQSIANALGLSPGKLFEDSSASMVRDPALDLKELIGLLSAFDDNQTKRVLAFAKSLPSSSAGASNPGPPKVPQSDQKSKRIAD